ncbi:MAG: DNRLRE domain-containing protein, partial [Hyphomicrobiales bacterium]
MMPCDKSSDRSKEAARAKGPSSLRAKRLMWIPILAALAMLLLPGYSEAANITKTWGECSDCNSKSVTEDSYIDSSTSANNFGAYDTVYVGRKGTATGDDRTYRGLIKFNFSNIPISNASQIISAKLWVYIAGNEGSGNIVDAHRVLKSWNQGNKNNSTGQTGEVTWRCQTVPTQWSAWGCDGSGTDREAAVAASTSINFNNTWFSFDVTSSVQWMFTNNQYFGWLLKRNTEPDAKNRLWFYSSTYGDASRRPFLEITYSDSAQLRVEPNSLSMVSAETKTATISGGAPGYTVTSSNPSVATAGINGSSITVTAVGQGSATITIRDSNNASVTLAVTVTAPLAAAPANLSLYPTQTATVTVSGGSPGYTVSSGNPAIAQASIAGSTVTITAVGAGAITVTVTDAANHHAYVVANVGATITPGLGTCPSPPFASAPMGPNVMIMFDTSGSMSDDEGDGISRFDEAKAAVIATLEANPNVRFGLTRMDGT